MKYATYNTAGSITGHYDDSIRAVIPAGAVVITDDQWQLSMSGRLWINPETGLVVELPPRPSAHHVVDGGAWVVDFGNLRARKIADLKASCEAACRTGWISSALGAPHTYDTDKDRDQVTLTALAVAALQQIMLGNTAWTYDVTCADAAGVKTMRPHTAAQLAQVGTEVQEMIKDNKARYYQLLAELEAAFQDGDEQAILAILF
jgi:hypothetical protein